MKDFLRLRLNTLNGSIQYLDEIIQKNEDIPSTNIKTHGEIIKNIGYDLITKADEMEQESKTD